MPEPSTTPAESDPARWGRPEAAVPFRAPAQQPSSSERERVTLRDRALLAIVLLAIVLQSISWYVASGYPIADSVEFMERAMIFTRGQEMIDAGAIRPFGFSFLLLPFFAIADWLGIRDLRPLVWCISALQMLFACALVVKCAHIGALLGGRRVGLGAAFLAATNPILLQYSAQPVSDIAAGLCVAFALELLFERAPFRKALIAGAWLGLAFVIAYKTLLFSLCLLAMVFVRDRFKHSSTWRGMLVGLGISLLVQSSLDALMYGQFGASVSNYLVQNTGSVLTSMLGRSYQWTHWGPLRKAAEYVYYTQQSLQGTDVTQRGATALRQKQEFLFYVQELPTMLVWPVIALAVIALVRCIVRPNWRSTLLVGVLVSSLLVLSNKGSKEFRLLLPLLALVLPLCAYGWDWLSSHWPARWSAARSAVLALGAGATLVLGMRGLLALNTVHYGGYWNAIDYVNQMARDTLPERRARAAQQGWPEPPRLLVGSAYHWAIFLRESPLVEVVKLPHQLNMWSQYAKFPGGGVQERAASMDVLDELDVFMVHLPIFVDAAQEPQPKHDLLTWLNANYEVRAAFYDHSTYDDLGPLFVLERRTGDRRARTFFDVTRGVSPEAFASERQLEGAMDFVDPESGERIRLLGVEYQPIGPEGYGWITYHWHAPAPVQRNYMIFDRITTRDESNVWNNDHFGAWGVHPTTSWKPDEIVSEGALVVANHIAYLPGSPYRPLGGGYRRGDLIPARLWMKLWEVSFDTKDRAPSFGKELLPARPLAREPLRPAELGGSMETSDGAEFSGDGFVRVFGFFLPVHPRARVVNDGRPLPVSDAP